MLLSTKPPCQPLLQINVEDITGKDRRNALSLSPVSMVFDYIPIIYSYRYVILCSFHYWFL